MMPDEVPARPVPVLGLILLALGALAVAEVIRWASRRARQRDMRLTARQKALAALVVGCLVVPIDTARIVVGGIAYPVAIHHWSNYVGWRAVRRLRRAAHRPTPTPNPRTLPIACQGPIVDGVPAAWSMVVTEDRGVTTHWETAEPVQ